jgi:uncharacterized protein (DUF1501 family)
MRFSRREFLKASLGASVAVSLPSVWLRAREASALEACEQGTNLILVELDGGNDGINTVVPLSNGSGQNRTVYDTVRRWLNIPVSELGATQIGNDPYRNGELALHPHMNGLKTLYDEGNLAVVLGAHYTNGNLSHDVSKSIWYKADPLLSGISDGWMGRTLDALCTGQRQPVPAVDVGRSLNPLFFGRTSVLAFTNTNDLAIPANPTFQRPEHIQPLEQAFRTIYEQLASNGEGFIQSWAQAGWAVASRMDAYRSVSSSTAANLTALINGADGHPIASPTPQRYGLAYALRMVYALLRGAQPGNQPLGCRVFRVGIGGFDTHSDQGRHIPLTEKSLHQKVADNFRNELHGKLLHQVDKAITAFWRDLEAANLHHNTLIMTFTEFGRRIAENGDNNADSGTDHGTASPVFIVGPRKTQSSVSTFLQGGVYGAYPELHLPDRNGNMVHTVDFRNIYGTIMVNWLGLSQATANNILGAGGFTYSPLDFLPT